MAKKKYYAVARGFKTGIFEVWSGPDGAQKQIMGYKNARYKGFPSKSDAQTWLDQKISGEHIPPKSKPAATPIIHPDGIVIYTDGGALNNPGPGGYGAILSFEGSEKEISGGYRKTTNNRMELLACIKALKLVRNKEKITLYTDSQYVVNGIQKGWAERWRKNRWYRNKLEKAENSDLWSELLELTKMHSITFQWVRGHTGVEGNERCDALVRKESVKSNLPPDLNYENQTTRDPVYRF